MTKILVIPMDKTKPKKSVTLPFIEAVILIHQDPSSYLWFKDPDDELGVRLVERDGMLLHMVVNPPMRTIEAALKQNPLAIKYVPAHRQTQELCDSVVKRNPLAMAYISATFMTTELCLFAIRKVPHTIKYVFRPTPKMIQIAVTRDPSVMGIIRNVPCDVILEVIRKDPMAFRFLHHQALPKAIYADICCLAVSMDRRILRFVKQHHLHPIDYAKVCETAKRPVKVSA